MAAAAASHTVAHLVKIGVTANLCRSGCSGVLAHHVAPDARIAKAHAKLDREDEGVL